MKATRKLTAKQKPETSAAGIQFDGVQVVDDFFQSGHPVDYVLTSLGKRRTDATSVFRYSSAASTSYSAV